MGRNGCFPVRCDLWVRVAVCSVIILVCVAVFSVIIRVRVAVFSVIIRVHHVTIRVQYNELPFILRVHPVTIWAHNGTVFALLQSATIQWRRRSSRAATTRKRTRKNWNWTSTRRTSGSRRSWAITPERTSSCGSWVPPGLVYCMCTKCVGGGGNSLIVVCYVPLQRSTCGATSFSVFTL